MSAKSVANNLNDISKTHPDLVVKISKDWYGKDEKTDWIVATDAGHFLRMATVTCWVFLGFTDSNCVKVDGFSLESSFVSVGGRITFTFLEIEALKAAKVRPEYGIDYVKAKGKRNRKIFQISELTFKEKGKKFYTKLIPLQIQVQGSITGESIQLR